MAELKSTRTHTDPFSRDVLEFPAVVELLHPYLSGPISEPRLARVAPHTDLGRIRRDLELAREAREYLREGTRPGLAGLIEPSPLLEQLRVEGVALEALEILALVQLARAGLDVCRTFAPSASQASHGAAMPYPSDSKGAPTTPRLDELARSLPDFRSLVGSLSGKINPDGTVESSASAELGRLRRNIERAKAEIQSSLDRLLRRFSQDGVVQDAVVTIRNDRFVIPVRAEEKRRVQGVVHGASSSGATVYVEPLETLTLNNDLVELQDREFAEVQRLLGEFTRQLQERREDLERASNILSEVDWAFAKGAFSKEFDCCTPELHQERAICLNGFVHPLLRQAVRTSADLKPVPLSLEILPPKTLMVISGPNTGGKTVTLKAVGIAVLMAQAGIPVPAAEVKLPLFTSVLADIGDQQSIEANLSTFSAHVLNISGMSMVAGPNDLVLLDEIGASTEPNEGAALAVAILEHFRQRGAITIVTTHHSRLKAYAAETAEAMNAAMEFDEASLQPTYRLLVGLPGKSSALDIAARLGLESGIVQKARSLLGPADAEATALIAELHQQRTEMERQLEALAIQKQEQEKRGEQLERQFQQDRRVKLKELDSRLDETLRQYAKTWEQSIDELRKQAAPAKVVNRGERRATGLVREAREEWNTQVLEALGEPAAVPHALPVAKPPAVGDRVEVLSVSTAGTIFALLPNGQLEVVVGSMKMRVDPDEVRPLSPAGAVAPLRPAPASRSDDVPEELNVIGNTAEEALERVDKFLDQAFLAGRPRVRIVHGHGKGILRRALHQMFTSHPQVEKFDLAPPSQGGAGATVVELKS